MTKALEYNFREIIVVKVVRLSSQEGTQSFLPEGQFIFHSTSTALYLWIQESHLRCIK